MKETFERRLEDNKKLLMEKFKKEFAQIYGVYVRNKR